MRAAFGHTSTPTDYRYLADENDPNCKLRIYRAFPRRQFNPPCLVVNAEASDARFRYLDKEVVADIFRVLDELVVYDGLQVLPVLRIVDIYDTIGTHYVEDTDFTYNKTTNKITWIAIRPDPYYAIYDTTTYISDIRTPVYAKRVQSQIVVPIKITIYALSTTDRERLTDLVTLYVRSVFRERFAPFCTYVDIKLGGEMQEEWENQVLYINTVTVECWTQFASEIDMSLYEFIRSFNIDITVDTTMGVD